MKNTKETNSRRKVVMAAALLAGHGTILPAEWIKPVARSVVLPVHARTSDDSENSRQSFSIDSDDEATRAAKCEFVIPGISNLCENADVEWFDFHVIDDRDGNCKLLKVDRSDFSRGNEIYRYFRPGNPPSANVTINSQIYVPGCNGVVEPTSREFDERFESLGGAAWRATGKITSDQEGLHIGDIRLTSVG